MQRRHVYEIGVASLILVVCAIIWAQASRLPPGTFEPLGSGPVPKWTSAIVMICCLVVIAKGLRRLGATVPGGSVVEDGGGTPRTTLLLCALTVVYVGLLDFEVASFGLITFGFLTFLIWGLEGFRRRVLTPALITSAIVAFGAEYLFTNVFVVDLPT